VGLSVTDPRTDFFLGPVLTWEILDSVRLNSPNCKLIFLSSAAVYGSPQYLPIDESHSMTPVSPYGYHKWQSELICREFTEMHGMQVASARIFSAYGPGLKRQVVWDLFYHAITRGVINAQGSGTESRDFIHVADVCAALETIFLRAAFNGESYNVSSGEETTISELTGLIRESVAPDCVVNFSGAVPPGTPLNWRADISRLRELGFSPKIKIKD
jgi:UDP-glucose 4-epimerase